jgi:hypothetical protein
MIGRTILKNGYILSAEEPVTDMDAASERIDEVAALIASSGCRKILINSAYAYQVWTPAQIPRLVELVDTRLPLGIQMAFTVADPDNRSKMTKLTDALTTAGRPAACFRDPGEALRWMGVEDTVRDQVSSQS